MQNPQFTQEDYDELARNFFSGDITQANKKQLERYAVMLSRPNVSGKFNATQFPQVCETVRMLLMVRISEKANKQATIVSYIALAVALAALICSAVQVKYGKESLELQRQSLKAPNLSAIESQPTASTILKNSKE